MEREDKFAALYKKLLRGCFEPDPRRAAETLRAVLEQIFPTLPEQIFPALPEPSENPLENRGDL